MVSARVLSAAGCHHCRSSVLRLFLTQATPLIRAPSVTTAPWRSAIAANRATRSYVSVPRSKDTSTSHDPEAALSEVEKLEGASTQQESVDLTPNSGKDEEAPWYLQVDPPRHVPTSEPPPLPEVPEGSPPIIPDLLKYAAEEMGLDELNLLDLREMDPPPALGTNLFMLFGTARSERHLMVSAGRLVRWLRAKHRIHADADGLLGPNERKTKLKRKAKRARLLGTMGTDDTDDGITTGWVCVNLGTINRSHAESAVVSEDGRVAGFGVPQTGSTIVVQVMTESRRAELGLETLWERALARQSQQPPSEEVAPKDSSEFRAHSDKSISTQAPTRPTLNSSSSTGSPFPDQARFFTTMASYKNRYESRIQYDRTAPSHDPLETALPTNLEELAKLMELPVSEHLDSFSGQATPLNEASGGFVSTLLEKLVQDGTSKLRMLALLRKHLESLSPADAFTTLKSTPFLKVSEIAMHNLPAEQTWTLRLSIESRSRQLGLQAHQSLDVTRGLISELQVTAIPASREQILQLLGCIYASPGPRLQEQTSLAMALLESVHTRGQSIITNDVIVAILEGMSWSGRSSQEALELQMRLEELAVQANLPYMGEPLLIRLMDAYARLGRREQFWETWRIPPRYAQPRSVNMYLHIYELAASTKNRAFCEEAIHYCFQEMLLENPTVEPVGKIRDALLQCISVVDPKAEAHADTIRSDATGLAGALVNREYVKLIKEVKSFRPSSSRS